MKVSRPTIYILVAAIAVAAWFLTSEDQAQRARSAQKRPASKTSTLPVGFTQEDLDAQFEPSKEPIKDAFRPLVERRRGGSETALAPNAVPSILTGGDPNWIYTGMAEVDGVSTGLLENKATGEADFVQHSQAWKDSNVSAISPFSIQLKGKNGKTYTMFIADETSNRTMMAQNGFSPLNPPLRGGIGAGLEVTPERPNRRSNSGEAANSQNGNGSIEVQND